VAASARTPLLVPQPAAEATPLARATVPSGRSERAPSTARPVAARPTRAAPTVPPVSWTGADAAAAPRPAAARTLVDRPGSRADTPPPERPSASARTPVSAPRTPARPRGPAAPRAGRVVWPQHAQRVADGRAVGGVELRALQVDRPEPAAPTPARRPGPPPTATRAEGTITRGDALSSRPGRVDVHVRDPAPEAAPAAEARSRVRPPPIRAAAKVLVEPPRRERSPEPQRTVRPTKVAKKKVIAKKAKRTPPPAAWRAPVEVVEAEAEAEQASRPQLRRATPAQRSRAAAPTPREQSEEQVLDVLRALVTRTPEARRLINDVYREIEALRKLDLMRKL
jgi:hypothetical protein